ncbi:MAG: UDP-N-acetylglucosamine 2-epimerase, partial [Muribaculaceae bacterium]|nr:UDP-N-acetylglucosamine 2-epimerase [Muribaculaceae bacterium]
EAFRRRVIAMGEAPERVINTGAIGVYNFFNEPLMSREELEASTGVDLSRDTILLTYHPATLDTVPAGRRMDAVIEAIERFPDLQVVVTYPNNDAGGREIIERIEAWQHRAPQRIKVIPSLGKTRYLSMLRVVKAVVGNSSSGLVEVPSAGIPTIDIGMRQQGRLAGESVIHADDDADSIASALAAVLSPEGQQKAAQAVNPYYRPDTLNIMADAIARLPLSTIKKFYDR